MSNVPGFPNLSYAVAVGLAKSIARRITLITLYRAKLFSKPTPTRVPATKRQNEREMHGDAKILF
jgi:hypothetical protein